MPKLSAAVEALKSKGNELFKGGQYGEAISYYTSAVRALDGGENGLYHGVPGGFLSGISDSKILQHCIVI